MSRGVAQSSAYRVIFQSCPVPIRYVNLMYLVPPCSKFVVVDRCVIFQLPRSAVAAVQDARSVVITMQMDVKIDDIMMDGSVDEDEIANRRQVQEVLLDGSIHICSRV